MASSDKFNKSLEHVDPDPVAMLNYYKYSRKLYKQVNFSDQSRGILSSTSEIQMLQSSSSVLRIRRSGCIRKHNQSGSNMSMSRGSVISMREMGSLAKSKGAINRQRTTEALER